MEAQGKEKCLGARIMVSGLKEQRANGCFLREIYRTLIKTQDYLDVFARFKQKENIEAVERMLTSKTELELFERSQLGILISLCVFDREEEGVLEADVFILT